MQIIKKLFAFTFVTLLMPFVMRAHDGHDDKPKTAAKEVSYFSTEAVSDVYELLLKYEPIQPGKEAVMRLFISNAITNAPVDSARLNLSVPEDSAIKFSIVQAGTGRYEIKATFKQRKTYNINVSLTGLYGPDLLLLQKVEVGKELPVEGANTGNAHAHWYSSNWFFALTGLAAGLLFMFLIMKSRARKYAVTAMVLLLLLPTATYNPVTAHGGEDHGDGGGAKKSGGLSTTLMVEKETQFLFGILTNKLETGDFTESKEIFATVAPAPAGKAVVQAPQTGKIVSLNVAVGQKVSKGQPVATIEQTIDAGTQISIISQKNSIESEYEAAKAQYERLKKIEDIAAKKDVIEAKARYESASKNKQLFESNAGRNTGNTKLVTLVAPVSGIVGPFNYSIGAVVSSGQTLFEITNLERLYAEAQVFSADVPLLKQATKFTAGSNNQNDTTSYPLQLVSTAQDVNQGNQSQRVLFEIFNPNGQFKIGENIRLRFFTDKTTRQLFVPESAIIDINGKPAVFIKDNAEQFSVSYVQQGESNGRSTVIVKGVEEGEKIVTGNVYQVKMIYQNQ